MRFASSKATEVISRLIAVLILIAIASAATADRLRFPDAGFSIAPPDGWVLQTAEEVIIGLESADYSEELENRVKTVAPDGLLVSAVMPTDGGPGPGFYVSIQEGEVSNLGGVMRANINQKRRLLEDFSLVSPPKSTSLSGRRAGVFRYDYSISGSGRRYEVTDTVWLIPMGARTLIISYGAETAKQAEVDAIQEAAARSILFER